MKFNENAVVMWAFLAILFHLFGKNWLVGLEIGLGISMIGVIFPPPTKE